MYSSSVNYDDSWYRTKCDLRSKHLQKAPECTGRVQSKGMNAEPETSAVRDSCRFWDESGEGTKCSAGGGGEDGGEAGCGWA